MTKKVKMKKKIGYILVDSKGRWVPEQVGSCDCSPEALVVHEDKDELYEGMYYTMVKVEIRELNSQKKKR